MKKLSHEEIISLKPSVEAVLQKKRNPIYILLDNIRSLHNVGAIFRTSDGVLVEKIFLCGITGTPPRNEIAKTALGAEEVVPWEYYKNSLEVVKKLKDEGIKIIAVELAHNSEIFWDRHYEFPICLVFGHEVNGVSDELMEHVDGAVHIPMLGRANSLNVATCFGVIVYDLLKKLSNKNV